ncbi:MAG: hypothetical protein LBQ48_02880 [Oscillospiraceae bacterium]|jgi:hypothetical protein|nr:hypothetical protein [Oscillospiraceae bacterium]
MAWFSNWWATLSTFQQIFAAMAIPASVVLMIQMVFLFIGLGSHGGDLSHGHDFDNDFDHDAAPDHDFSAHDHESGGNDYGHDGLRLLTVRGIVAFFAVGGWSGVALLDSGAAPSLAVGLAVLIGIAMMLIVALIMMFAVRLQENGNLQYENAVGLNATVYITIPPAQSGRGKINLNLQEQFIEADAVTDAAIPIKPGRQVKIAAALDENTFLVSSVES